MRGPLPPADNSETSISPSATTAVSSGHSPALNSVASGPMFYCEHCKGPSQFVGISRVVRSIGVSRSTIYYWMERGWIHWRVLPSRRRVICLTSLSSPARTPAPHRKSLAVGGTHS